MRSLRYSLLSALLCVAAGGVLLVAAPARAANEASAAREHYKRGTTLYDLGKYDEAIVEFQQAYEIKDDPVLLYNIAQAYRLSNKYSEALRFYRTYLRKSPKAPNREEVEQKIADMETLIQTQNRVMTAPPAEAIPPRGDRSASGIASRPPSTTPEPRGYTPPPPPDSSSSTPSTTEPKTTTPTTPEPSTTEPSTTEPTDSGQARVQTREEVVKPDPERRVDKDTSPGRGKVIGGAVLAGVGALVAGGGAAMGVLAMNKANEQQSSPVFLPDTESSGKTFTMLSYVLYGVGGALLVTGVVVAVLGVKQNAAARETTTAWKPIVAPVVSPTFAGGALHFRF